MTSYTLLASPGSNNNFYISLKLVYFVFTLVVSADPSSYDPAVDIHSKSMVGFCDGEFYVPKSKNSCSHGINFGSHPPKCVCIKGAYQLHMDNCQTANGFAEEVCTLVEDTVLDYMIKGIKLTKEFEWDKVGLVCNRMLGTGTEWDYVENNGKAKINHLTTNFYTINGKAMISEPITGAKKSKGNPQICIAKETSPKVICNYLHTENVNAWGINKVTNIIVRDKCTDTADAKWAPLQPNSCFNPLTLYDAECQVPCRKTNFFSRGSGLVDVEDIDGTPNLEGNCTDPKGFFGHENNFMDRTLLMYMVLDQIRAADDTRNVTLAEPSTEGLKRAYILYNLVKEIALKACEHPYLKMTTLKWASKFFVYLQKATKLQYEIKISDEDFKWIEAILTKCSARTVTITLSTKDEDAKCASGHERATGYCRPHKLPPPKETKNDTSGENAISGEEEEEPPFGGCDYREVKISQLYSNYEKKHYVPEYNWLFLDIVHISCFADFKESYRMFHILEQAFEQLFTTPIRDYWNFPRWSNSTKTSMFTVEADTVMWNAQICAQSVYNHHKNKVFRLSRPSRPKYPMRRKRAAEVLSTTSDVMCAISTRDFKFPQGCDAAVVRSSVKKPKVNS